MSELRIMLVDDHAVLRAGLQLLIDGQPDMRVISEAGSVQEALRLVAETAVDVIVMDISLPDGDGIAATAQLRQICPGIQVVGLTRHADRGYMQRMLGVGARGYVLKQAIAEALINAIRIVAAGGTYIDPVFASEHQGHHTEHGDTLDLEAVRAPEDTTSELTADEVAVLQRVAWGYTNSEIAEHLGIPPATATEHKARAMRKLGLRTRIDVLRYAEAQGWKRADTDRL